MGILKVGGTASLAAALSLCVLAACGEDAAQAPGPAAVETARVAAKDVPTVITAVGTVEADHQTAVSAEVAGRVARIIRDEGSVVGAGAAVIQLDPGASAFGSASAGADVARARAQLTADEALFARYAQLLAAGAIDRQTYENLEAKVAAERAAVAQARAALGSASWDVGKATVRAPFAGTVGHRYVELGQYVDAQQIVFDLVDAQPLRIRFRVPEIHAGAIHAGDQVRFRVRSDTVSTRLATVNYVGPSIDPATRTFEVTAIYTNDDRAVRPGAFADVAVTTAVHKGAPVVPEAAIVTEGESNFVFVVARDSARQRAVTIGSQTGGEVEILTGVKPGEIVITAGQHGLPDGTPVRAVAPASTE